MEIDRHHQALVGDHLGRQRADVEVLLVAQHLLGPAAGHEQIDVEALGVAELARLNEQMANARQAGAGDGPAVGGIHRHVAPAADHQAAGTQLTFQDAAGASLLGVVVGQKHRAHGEQFTQLDVERLGGGLAHEGLGHFQQQTAAVTGLAIGGNTAAMGHAGERLDGGTQQIVAGLPFHMCDQAEPAVVTELAWLMKASVHGRASENDY